MKSINYCAWMSLYVCARVCVCVCVCVSSLSRGVTTHKILRFNKIAFISYTTDTFPMDHIVRYGALWRRQDRFPYGTLDASNEFRFKSSRIFSPCDIHHSGIMKNAVDHSNQNQSSYQFWRRLSLLHLMFGLCRNDFSAVRFGWQKKGKSTGTDIVTPHIGCIKQICIFSRNGNGEKEDFCEREGERERDGEWKKKR